MRLEHSTRRFYLGRDYGEAVEAFGGIPIHIALIPNKEFIEDALTDVDGILLPGSDSDVDPGYYNEDPHPKLGAVVPEKDLTDRLVLDAAEKQEKAVLAICFGMQALNVHRGGSLIQDIPSQIDGHLKHDQGIPRDRNSHAIEIEHDCLLSELAGSRTAAVNSHHHQAIAKLGANLKATARTSDGVVECIEDDRPDRRVLGVQWHPELSWQNDRLSKRIFEWFVERAAN